MNSDENIARIRSDDELIDLAKVRALMGGLSVSSVYEDGPLMALRFSMSPPGRRSKRVRFILREILELRAQRVAAAQACNANVQAEIEERVALRRKKQRLRKRAEAEA